MTVQCAKFQNLRADFRLISVRTSLLMVLLLAIMTSKASAQSAPGMSFIALSAHAAPQLQAVLTGQTPGSIGAYLSLPDPSGGIAIYQPTGATTASQNAFFSNGLTNNGRTCFTCHQPQNDWEISPPQILAQYRRTQGKSALFQPIDAAVCPDAPGVMASFSDPAFVQARSQLFNRGNFRISLNAPNALGPQDQTHITFDGTAAPEWVLAVEYDPTGCELDPVYGLPNNLLSVYRRPLPSANVAFLAQYDQTGNPKKFDIMWDGRERNLRTQFIDATLFHGQIDTPPDDESVTEGVRFQAGMFVGQVYGNAARDLTGGDGSGALGGPVNLYDLRQSSATPCSSSSTLSGELVCPPINQKVTLDDGTKVNLGSSLYAAFTGPTSRNPVSEAMRESIARGETIFNTRLFTIDHVAGLNDIKKDVLGSETGTCTTCHSNLNVNDDTKHDPKRLGIMDNSTGVAVMPWTADFPRFAFYCPIGTIPYFSNPVSSPNCPGGVTPCDKFITTDPGKGLIDGKCADLGKMKVPVLRGLAAREPYFHGGNAATLLDVINFYDRRFNIGFTDQEKDDLIAFLSSL
jgi:cytochrome c peroxidase